MHRWTWVGEAGHIKPLPQGQMVVSMDFGLGLVSGIVIHSPQNFDQFPHTNPQEEEGFFSLYNSCCIFIKRCAVLVILCDIFLFFAQNWKFSKICQTTRLQKRSRVQFEFGIYYFSKWQ